MHETDTNISGSSRSRRMRNKASPRINSISYSGDSDAGTTPLRTDKTNYEESGQITPVANSPLTIENINSILIDRLDKNVTLQTEILSRLEKLMAVQEEKIDQQERLGATLVKLIEDRRNDSDRKFDDQTKKIVEVERNISTTLVTHLNELKVSQGDRHKEFAQQQKNQLETFTTSLTSINDKVDNRISKIEKIIYGILGIAGVGAVFFEYVLPLMLHVK